MTSTQPQHDAADPGNVIPAGSTHVADLAPGVELWQPPVVTDPGTSEHVFLVAHVVETPATVSRAAAERALHTVLPAAGARTGEVPGATVSEWWVAEDDRQDRSDNDSTIFVGKGEQARETFDRLPEEARRVIRAALDDAACYRWPGDEDPECGYCDRLLDAHTGDDPAPLCDDHTADLDAARSYRALLDLLGA